VVPGRGPEASRVRLAKPPAGAALAPSDGRPTGSDAPHERGECGVCDGGKIVKDYILIARAVMPAKAGIQ
jgi:hypothetical protein